MDTPLRRSRRLEGLNPLSLETLPDSAVSRAKQALVVFESNPKETSEPESPRVPPLDLVSPRPQSETSPGSPYLRQDAGFEFPPSQPEPDPRSLQPHQDLGLESPAGQTESSPESPQREESSKFSATQGELEEEVDHAKEEEVIPGPPQHPLQPGPRSPEPCTGQQAPGPEPSQPAQELTSQAPSSPEHQQEPSKLRPAGETVAGGLDIKKRVLSYPQAPAPKKLKEEELPVIPKGKPKSGRVWKDRSKKR